MKKDEAKKRKVEIEEEISKLQNERTEMQKIIDAPVITKEQRFINLMNNLVRKTDYEARPGSIFFFTQEGKFMLEQDYNNGYAWFNYYEIWMVFVNEFGLNGSQTQEFLSDMLEEHFKCKGLTPVAPIFSLAEQLEEHFKCKGLTPHKSRGHHVPLPLIEYRQIASDIL